jgi:hypothetical protein
MLQTKWRITARPFTGMESGSSTPTNMMACLVSHSVQLYIEQPCALIEPTTESALRHLAKPTLTDGGQLNMERLVLEAGDDRHTQINY